MDAKPAADSRAEITHWMGVTDANSRGNIHGGTIMKLADEAAALAAIKHSRQRVVTVGWTGWTSWCRSTSASSSPSGPRSTPPGGPRWRSACASRPRTR